MKPVAILVKNKDVKDYILGKNPQWEQLKTYIKSYPYSKIYIKTGQLVNKNRGFGDCEFDSWQNCSQFKIEETVKAWGCDFKWYSPRNERILKRCLR